MYTETDFFLALLKPKDWLKDNAEKIYKKHKDDIWTSTHTLTTPAGRGVAFSYSTVLFLSQSISLW